MEKIDEYVEQYKAAKDKAAVTATILRMMLVDEVRALTKERGVQTDRAACAIFTEQDNRWHSFVRKVRESTDVDAVEMPNPEAFVHFHPKIWGRDVTGVWLASRVSRAHN